MNNSISDNASEQFPIKIKSPFSARLQRFHWTMASVMHLLHMYFSPFYLWLVWIYVNTVMSRWFSSFIFYYLPAVSVAITHVYSRRASFPGQCGPAGSSSDVTCYHSTPVVSHNKCQFNNATHQTTQPGAAVSRMLKLWNLKKVTSLHQK